MSEFDKEAERQKLREKYAEDADDRAATQRMSQLLLQGATMTNHHCEDCGDPRFRYDGREFCPSCEGLEGGTSVEEQQSNNDGHDSHTEDQHAPPAPEEPSVETSRSESSSPGDTTASTGPTANESPPQGPTEKRSATGHSARGDADQPIDSDLAEARRTLARSVRSLAERGATAEDPRRAREHLEAAREAAEALSALHR